MKIIEVNSRQEMKKFVFLPKLLFNKEPCYIPPIWFEEKKAYSAKHNPILKNSDFQLFILLDEKGDTIGRNLAYVDHTHNRYYGVKMGFFGAFECINDTSGAQMLIDAAQDWIKEKGMVRIRGPINPVAENWGFVQKGFNTPPVYMSPWNPPYYNDFFIKAGYEKAKDLLVYDADISKGYSIPQRYHLFKTKFMKRYPDVSLRRINMKHIKEDAKAIWEISNIALADNWGFVPLELSVMEDMLRKLKLIVDPDAIWMVEDNKMAVGFCLGFPDINILLAKIKGNLFPFGWIRLLLGAKKLKDYRLFGLAVLPEWQEKGLDSLMYINLYEHLKNRGVRMEANYILEDNHSIKNGLEKLGMKQIKTYRIYEKTLE